MDDARNSPDEGDAAVAQEESDLLTSHRALDVLSLHLGEHLRAEASLQRLLYLTVHPEGPPGGSDLDDVFGLPQRREDRSDRL